MSEPAFVAATLKWCNELRKEQGKKPLDKLPTGKRKDPDSCPCGKAANLFVGTAYYAHLPKKKYNTMLVLPATVMDFVKHFDRGDLPQYEE